MTINHDTSTSEDDSLMVQANEQLECEQLQSQQPTFATNRAHRCVVSLGISLGYVKDWMPASRCFPGIVSKLVCAGLFRRTNANQRRMPSLKDSSLTVRASSRSWKTTVTISQSLFLTKPCRPARGVPKQGPVASRSQIHACNYPPML